MHLEKNTLMSAVHMNVINVHWRLLPIVLLQTGGGATETYQTPSWVTVFTTGNQPPPHIPSMWVSVFESKKVSPPRLTSMWVNVFLLDDGAA